jgi:serine/threonine-protein kinase
MPTLMTDFQDARLELLGRLGRGGMAQIHLARQHSPSGPSRVVAVKQARRDMEGGDDVGSALRHEARIMALLRHPNLVRVHDFVDFDGDGYLVMEAVDGVSVSQLLGRLGRLPAPVAAHLGACAALGLHAAHEVTDENGRRLGLVHRDVSPDNILIDWSGQVKVSDFGIALVTTQRRVTAPGMVKGKFSYMAPEQLHQRNLDRRSDVYSLGAVLYEMLAGRAPFAGNKSDAALLYAIVNAAPPPLPGDIPPAMANLVMECLQKEPASRPASGAALAERLKACAGASDADALKALLDRAYPPGDAQRKLFSSLLSGELQFAPEGTRRVRKEQAEPSALPPIQPVPRPRAWRRVGMGAAALLALAVLGWHQSVQMNAGEGNVSSAPSVVSEASTLTAALPDVPAGLQPLPEATPPLEVKASSVQARTEKQKAGSRSRRLAASREKDPPVARSILTISGPASCDVSVDGRALGPLVNSPVVHLNPGVHRVVCKGGPNNLNLRRQVVLRKNESKKLELLPGTGTLLVKVSPWGDVYLNGRSLGSSPLQPLSVGEGRHRLDVVHPSGQKAHAEVVVVPQKTEIVRIILPVQ